MIAQAAEMSSDRSILSAMIELAFADRGGWEATIQQILRLEARVLDVERMTFWSLRKEEKTLVCEMAYQRTTGDFERGFTLEIGGHERDFGIIMQSEPVICENCRDVPSLHIFRDYIQAHEITSVLAYPVRANGQLAGILCSEHVGRPRGWSTSDQQFAAAVAQAASAALEARARSKAQESALRAEFFDRTSRTVNETLDVDQVARVAIALALPKLADGADILLVEEHGIERVAFDYVTEKGRVVLGAFLPLGPVAPDNVAIHLPSRVIAGRSSILVQDVGEGFAARLQAPELVRAMNELGIRSMLSVPLLVGERVTGVITMGTAARRYDIDDLGVGEEFARRLASALENARLHGRLCAAVECAEAAVRARDEFIALAGHELRTPLTTARLTAQKLVRRSPNNPGDDVHRIAALLLRQLKRLEDLSAGMLDAARFPEHKLPLSRARADLADIARDAAEGFEPLLQREGCSLMILHADTPVVGEWDAAQLQRAVSSLLDNAMKFGAGKPVDVAVRREGNDAILSVTDHGQGVPADRVAHIFDAFERAVPVSNYGGLGLGLFIARSIVESHGGRLTVDNHPGEGATFTARLPLEPPPPSATDNHPA
jgi:signal transduction histidine kinase